MAMETTASLDVISLNLNLDQYTKPDLANHVVVLDKSYEADSSSSTTTASSPVISSHQIEPLCPCNDLTLSNLGCDKCNLSYIQQQHSRSKNQLENLREAKVSLLTEQDKLESHIVELGNSLRDKLKSIETTAESITSLQYDLKILDTKCREEASEVEDIQRSKETVKKELEELSTRLFEEADKLVKLEKAEQEIIKSKNNQLTIDLKSAQSSLADTESQLKLIKNELGEETQLDSSRVETSPYQNAETAINTYTRAQIELSLMHGMELELFMDTLENDNALMEFNDFIQSLYKTPLRKINSLKYMKYCIREDIEPCLRFGPNPKLASKKIIDAILVKACHVEECPEGFVNEQAERQLKEEATATLWERFVTSSVFLGCQACGREADESSARPELLKYRFRISYFDEWACIDRYCRDRLLAVAEFYLFIRHLRAGMYKHRSLHELYQESIRLKLQMFLARTGSLPNMLQSCGVDPEKVASAFHGEVNSSILSLAEASITSERLSSSTESSLTISTIESARTSTSFF
ncbi:Rab-3A-interacting protein [Choanephora cucurbitarum]|uniref:Rab-3A-interacting protein n=1 Tax=Choanephora cucurbitarum TaxID=101091 RepID=A0A1C7NMW8_9FUNG|nr:Rab-3A-interacting protein [Choanephora cucurbitarum]